LKKRKESVTREEKICPAQQGREEGVPLTVPEGKKKKSRKKHFATAKKRREGRALAIGGKKKTIGE